MYKSAKFGDAEPTRQGRHKKQRFMQTKKKQWGCVWMTACLALVSAPGEAQVYDFEDCKIGQAFTMWNVDQGVVTTSTAKVVADPANASNKVLHVTSRQWGTFPTIVLPKELAGHQLTDKKKYLTFDFCRTDADDAPWAQFHAYLGSDKLYQDDGYPYKGEKNQWQHLSYTLNEVSTASSDETRLHFGIHSPSADYYIDNVELKGEYDGWMVADNNLVDICEKNTDKSYTVYETPILATEGKSLDLRTSRYTYWNSKVAGKGTINLYAGGERTYLGNKASKVYHPDWSQFSGTLHIFPYKDVEPEAGFYGLVWQSGKTFAPDNAAQNASDGNVNATLSGTHVVLHDGAAMACESGKRGLRIARLDTDEGSTLYGYLKAKANNDGYYMVGSDNADGTLAGRIIPFGGTNLSVKVGLVKEGTGTYRITGNENLITGSVRVLQGAVMVNNDAAKAERSRLSGGIGQQSVASAPGVYVMSKGCLGGVGSIGSTVDLYGTLTPGDGGIGTLALKNFATSAKPNLVVHPKSKIKFEVTDSERYDQLHVDGTLTLNDKMEDFTVSGEKPRIYIELTSNPTLKVGDRLPLLTYASKSEGLEFEMRYPKQYTWKTSEVKQTDGTLALVACVTSLEYGGQGEWTEDTEDDTRPDDTSIDIDKEKLDATPLRVYAENAGKYVGTCVSLYDGKINLEDEHDEKTQLLTRQFNMVVCENEMKFDATQPSQGVFNYYNGDRLVAFARKHNMRIRGHALVWHSQVPAWLSSDGKKNDKNFTRQQLLDIMEKHIGNVVTHWKGKVAEWDVCNEVLDDDQSVVRTDPDGYKLRASSIWNYAGEDYVAQAFRLARKADPDAQLILNDYGVEFQGQAKAEAFYNLAKHLKESGVPIDGVGLQCHLDVGKVDAARLKATVDRFNAIGLRCVITELDLGMTDSEANRLQQAKDFYNIAKVAMGAGNCNELTVWGLTDAMTWRGGRNPLLYDGSLNPKPAYYGMHAGVREAAQATGIENAQVDGAADAQTVSETCYTLQGQRIASPLPGRICIVCRKMSDGGVVSVKVKR